MRNKKSTVHRPIKSTESPAIGSDAYMVAYMVAHGFRASTPEEKKKYGRFVKKRGVTITADSATTIIL